MSSTIGTFTFGERLGMLFGAQAGFLSMVAVSTLLCAIIYKTIKNRVADRMTPKKPKWSFFRSSMDYLFVNLLFNDLIQSMGYVTILAWVRDGEVTPGPTCTAQGVLQHIGEVGSALATLSIAVYTFLALLLPWTVHNPERPWLMPLIVFGLISLFQLLMSVVPAVAIYDRPEDPFYGAAGYWCWIRSTHGGERLGLEYVILWFVAIVNTLLYIPLFLSLRGNLVVQPLIDSDSTGWWKISITWRRVSDEDKWSLGSEGRFKKLAKQMLAYPIVYILLILPITINRWAAPNVPNWPNEVPFFVCTVFALSGLVNAVLYVATRPSLSPFRGCCARTGLVDEEDDEEKMIKRERRKNANNQNSRKQPSEGQTTVYTVEENKEHLDGIKPQTLAAPTNGPPMLDDDSSEEGVQLASTLGRGNGPSRVHLDGITSH
ncbi:hypothetical protein FRC03_008154 [Tulasnella sp. 419]|nr:hypothetical protein FRC03_008154 [Tulasnella sp. 419]